jgi:restriction system protein
MARRGFFAELQHQARVAAREQERQERQAVRDHVARLRRAEQARKEELRAQKEWAKAAETERKGLEREAKEARLEAMEAEVDKLNSELAEVNEDLDSLLASTLARDDFVDLESLRVEATHPHFDPAGLDVPIPAPPKIPDIARPVLSSPPPLRGFAKLFGKKKHQQAVEDAERRHSEALAAWRVQCRQQEAQWNAAQEKHARKEEKRRSDLEAAHTQYYKACAARQQEVADRNQRLDEFIANLGYGTTEAVQEYVSIVLSNSVYPQHFKVLHGFDFDPVSAEMQLAVQVPGPEEVSDVKTYKYNKSADGIVSVKLSQKECRERYASAINQVALRSIHEVFEADRRGLIRTISLEVGTNTIDPATGRPACVPFVIVAAARDAFMQLNLAAIVPSMTLERLGAVVSKNPHGLAPAERKGVRRA